MKKYIKVNNTKGITHLKIELYYYLGGCNYFTYKQEERGYYISISPVERSECGGCIMESYTAFSGTKYCLHKVQRKSAKAEQVANEKALQCEKALIEMVCNANGIKMEDLEQ